MPDIHDSTTGSSESSSHTLASTASEHLNDTGCRIRYLERGGRKVYASRAIPAHTLLENSPALLFSAEEYEAHGRHTVLDRHSFQWKDGRMALALGLGSLFNRSDTPNVSYTIDTATESIRFTTARAVELDEELCVRYNHDPSLSSEELGSNGSVELADDATPDPNEILLDDDLPFTRVKLTSDEDDEETAETVRTVHAWAVDIPDPRQITSTLRYLTHPHPHPLLSSPPLSSQMAQILRPRHANPRAPQARAQIPHSSTFLHPPHRIPNRTHAPHRHRPPPPYQLPVPRSAALTPASLALKNTLWPTVFAPRRKGEPEDWTRARAHWACAAMTRVVQVAHAARAAGELPIASYVPAPPEEPAWPSYLAHDTRVSSVHPLRHAVLNVVRALSDPTAASATLAAPSPSLPIPTPASASHGPGLSPSPSPTAEAAAAVKNGQHYLLTSRTLFTTHEPCVMCTMALLHSRVKEVFFLIPMERTGGCGGAVCVPRLEGVNHRFAIGRWKVGAGGVSADRLEVNGDIDS
ncbi:hypothetical protein EI94DRAFT_1826683 [Lactarius quietus]|nr:hypothetical protein EI94DRAFT_1826683 [Lactarius quietus]